MNGGLLLNGILPPAVWDHPELSWFDYSRCTWMASNKLSNNNRLTVNVLCAPPPAGSTNEEPRDSQQPEHTCTPHPPKIKVLGQVVGVENVGGTAYGKATGLYNKHRKYSDHWNPWHPFQSTHDIQHAQLFSQQTNGRMDQDHSHGQDTYKIKTLQSADALQKLLSELDSGISNDHWIYDGSHIIRTLYNWDIFNCIQCLLANHPFKVYIDFEPAPITNSEGCRKYCEMNIGNWWWDTQDQLCAGATIDSHRSHHIPISSSS